MGETQSVESNNIPEISHISQIYIYVLELENHKYYIGKTTNPDMRIGDHMVSIGSHWTTMYPPVKIVEIIPNCDNLDEDKYTLKYMSIYGINNVRGGTFCEIILTTDYFNTIITMLKGSNNLCYVCGSKLHFANKCDQVPQKKCSICKKIGHLTSECKSKEEKSVTISELPNYCSRCKRKGHVAEKCYAKTDIKGIELKSNNNGDFSCQYCQRKFTSQKGATYHENIYCNKK